MISKRKEAAAINRNYTCPNPSCGKPFAKPLKAINMALDNPEPYLACPHCLTEITTPENPPSPRTKPNPDTEPSQTTQEETSAAEEKTTQAPKHGAPNTSDTSANAQTKKKYPKNASPAQT